MDIWGCQLPPTRAEIVTLYIMLIAGVACVVLGFPFIIWVAVCGETLCF